MKIEYKIIAISIVFGLFVWIADAVLDYLFFYEGTFVELLITQVPAHEQYIRSFILASFITFGTFMSVIIAKRKQSEEALRQSETNYQEIWNGVNDAICIHDIETGAFLDINRKMCDMLGYSPEDFKQLTVEDVGPGQPPFNNEYAVKLIKKTVHEGPQLIEWQAKDRNGRLFWVEVNLKHAVINGRDRVLAVIRDISEHKQAEQELRRSRKNWQNIFQAIGHPTIILDQDHQIIAANRATLKATGNTENELKGKRCYQVFHGRESTPQQCPMEKLIKSGHMETVEMEMEAFGGIYLVSCTPMLDEQGHLDKIIHIATDITERKQAEKELRKEMDKAQHYLDIAGIIFLVNNAQQKTTLINKYGCDILGVPENKIIGKNWFNTFVPERERNKVKGNFSKLIAEQTGAQEYTENYILTASGAERLIAWHNTILQDETGNVFGTLSSGQDITERKEAEKALSASEANYRTIFDEVNDTIVVHDPQTGAVLDTNRKAHEMFGYTREEFRQLRVNDFSLGEPPYTQNEALQLIHKAAKGEPQLFEWLCKDRSGRQFWVEVNLKCAVIGGLDRVMAVVRDITERKRDEKKIGYLAKFPSENPNPVLRIAGNGQLLYANPASDPLLSEWGCQIDQTVPQKWRKIVYEALESGPAKKIEVVYAGKTWSFVVAPVKEAGYVNLYARDITDRIEAEEAVRLSEINYRSIFNTANDAIFIHDVETGQILDVNQKMCDMYGYTVREARQVNVEALSSGRPPHSQKEALQWIKKAADGDPQLFEWMAKDKNGRLFWVEVNLKRVVIGGTDRLLAIVRDITERKRAEEELSKYRHHLEELVEQRTAEMTAANKELESFCYSVSHDLHAPLRAMHGFSQALIEDHAKQLDKQGKKYLQRIQAASRRMDQLIDDLLDLSRLTRGEIHRQTVDLSDLAENIATELQQTQPQRNVTWVIEKDIQAHGDRRLLRVLMENLFGNAWKFTGKHSNAKIEFGITKHQGKNVYFVRDDGAGFDMAYTDKLFSPFQRMHNATEFEGIGIGLATVQRITNRHGGQIWAEAKVEQGATFYFTLPRKADTKIS
ncbi:MAG: PAS domain-containing sensor histidine kinase [Planctomycetota bacterium]|jgi:PAS domain S-box-containing protein